MHLSDCTVTFGQAAANIGQSGEAISATAAAEKPTSRDKRAQKHIARRVLCSTQNVRGHPNEPTPTIIITQLNRCFRESAITNEIKSFFLLFIGRPRGWRRGSNY